MPLPRVFDGFASPGRRGSIKDSRQGGALRPLGIALAALSVLLVGCSSASAPPPQPAGTGQPFDAYQLTNDGQEVVVLFWGAPDEPGPCGVDYPAQASETSDRVYIRVRAFPHHQGPAPVACPAIAQRRTATVRLEAPVGARAVVDGTTGDLLVQPTGGR